MFAFYLQLGNEIIRLSGAGIEAPVMGCRRKPGKDLGDTFEEQVEVILRGGPGLIDGWIRKMEAVFTRIKFGEGKAFLWLQSEQRVTALCSMVMNGRIEFLGHGAADLKQGGMGVCLYLTRKNYWTDAITAVELSNIHGNLLYGGIRVDNSFSVANGKNNFVRIAEGEIKGELPAASKIFIRNLDSGRVIANLYLGLDAFYGLDGGEGYLEAENGASAESLSVLMDPTASGGAYGKVTWGVAAEIEALYWSLSGETVTRFGGRLVRPVLRLNTVPANDDYWVRCAVKQGVAVEYSAWQRLESDKMLQALPAIHIPPRGLGSLEMDEVRISLMMRRNQPGSHELSFDFLQLLAVDGFRHYSGLGSGGLAYNERLVDSLEEGLVYSEAAGSGLGMLTHQAIGKGIWLLPEMEQRITFLFDEVGGDCRVDSSVELLLYQVPTRKNV